MVHLDNLDVVGVVERRRDALDQGRQQVDAEAHIAGLDDDGAARRRGDDGLFLGRMAGSADDMDDAGGRGQLGEGERRRRDGELDQPVGVFEKRRNVADDLDAVATEPGKLAGIAADHRGVRGVDGAGQRQPLGLSDGMDQRAAHAPAGAGDHQAHGGIRRR